MKSVGRWLLILIAGGIATTRAFADTYKVEALGEGPPATLAAAIKDGLQSKGYRVLNGDGKPFADFWVRKAIPAAGKPAGPKGPVQFPFLAEGEFLGVLRFAVEAHDYRDQTIPKGLYTIRYGLQPVNGDHLGVSVFRDYALLIPAAKDTSSAILTRQKLEDQSKESVGSSHPAVLMLLAAPAGAPGNGNATMVHDEAKDLWGAVVPLPLAINGEASPLIFPAQLVVVGTAMP